MLGPPGIDGKFGPRTESAVKAFQRDNALQVDGIVGPITWGAICKKVTTSPAQTSSLPSGQPTTTTPKQPTTTTPKQPTTTTPKQPTTTTPKQPTTTTPKQPTTTTPKQPTTTTPKQPTTTTPKQPTTTTPKQPTTAPVPEQQLVCSDGTAPDVTTGLCADGSQPQAIQCYGCSVNFSSCYY